ncbi:MAG TPA: ceramide glucosyltransferase [Amaricoccus sp.]|nr:ceramide glucosyltransferase [Amaricoccus sp.]
MMASILLAAALAALAAHLATIGLYLARRRGPGGNLGLPAVTLLRPVCGRDSYDAETLGSSFGQDYPDYEIIFCAPSDHDPAVALVRALIAAHPGTRARLLVGDNAITGNPKLNNLLKGWKAAAHDWVCMTDSNLLLPADYLRTVVGTWEADTGLVSSPPVGTRPAGFASHLECAFLNGNQARLQVASDSLGFGFAQGKTLFWNRRMLDRAGGPPALGRRLAEDVGATRLVRAMGLRVRLTPRPFAQPIGPRTFRQVWDRQLRWSRVRRDGFPLLFAAEIANGAALPTAALALAGVMLALPAAVLGGSVAAFLALWYGAEALLARHAGWPAGPADIAAMPVRDLLLPLLWAATFGARGIAWRGTAMAPPAFGEERVR